MEVGGPRSHSERKKSENRPNIVLYQYRHVLVSCVNIPCVLCVYIGL